MSEVQMWLATKPDGKIFETSDGDYMGREQVAVVAVTDYDALRAERDAYKSIVDQLRHCIEGGATISRHSDDIPVLQPPQGISIADAWSTHRAWTGGLSIRFPKSTADSAGAVQGSEP